MVWQEAAQLPGIYKMGYRFAGLRPVSIVTHMIFLCVAFHAAFAAKPVSDNVCKINCSARC
ncbi:hypothetical protein JNA67_18645 [Escherichia coli]|nr:hypothetical protein [Escherichia coli]